jgi:GntR family transcriptional regulator, transcriptional repressor for pyruvate dehydrogenase complex
VTATPATGSASPAFPEEVVFAPVRSQTAFEETVDRLGTAIRLGLLAPGTRLPAERELCARLGIARSTLRQALSALAQIGLLHAVRGRGGGTFVADPQPAIEPPSVELLANWREVADSRLAVEVGIVMLAAERASEAALDQLDTLVDAMYIQLDDYPAYRQSDVLFHVGLAESTGSQRLIAAMTVTQGEMTGLIQCISHPYEVLRSANQQHRRLVQALRDRDGSRAARSMADQARATEHVLAGLLPGIENRS